MSKWSERTRRIRRDLSPDERAHEELVAVTIQSGALASLGMHKYRSWQGFGEIEADVDSFDEETGARRVETRLVFPQADADQATSVAVGAELLLTGETAVYATSEGREIFRAPYTGNDLRREVTIALNADAVRRKSRGYLPPHVKFNKIQISSLEVTI